MTVTYRVGDTRQVVATLPDASVSLVASSPPFIALRSYLPDGHPDKANEIGSEPDPATFLDTLLGLTAEWGRVLAPWGSIAIELGDTYAGSTGAGGDYQVRDVDGRATRRESFITNGVQPNTTPRKVGWPRAKSLALIPQLYATSLAYGRNLLTGQPSPAGQWLVRNVIVWHRPNPAVGALGDKVRPSTSYITVATRSPKRWFDLDAVRRANPRVAETPPRSLLNRGAPGYHTADAGGVVQNPAGAPPLDCWFDEHDTWTITTQPSSLAHYAMWPAKLAERLILMMCPAEVCAVCGTPRRRITARPMAIGVGHVVNQQPGNERHHLSTAVHDVATVETLGWSDCGCVPCACGPACKALCSERAYVPGVVLDPFAGTGTTLAVADIHGRDAIGIDIDERNRELYPQRRDECARALFGVRPQMEGQASLW